MEPAILDLVRELEPAILELIRDLDDSGRLRVPELEVDIEVLDDVLHDPWFQRSEADFAAIEDDPSAQIVEIRVRDYGPAFAF